MFSSISWRILDPYKSFTPWWINLKWEEKYYGQHGTIWKTFVILFYYAEGVFSSQIFPCLLSYRSHYLTYVLKVKLFFENKRKIKVLRIILLAMHMLRKSYHKFRGSKKSRILGLNKCRLIWIKRIYAPE